jgi:hypothetical protein
MHADDIFGVSVDSQADELLIKVVNGVVMLQEEATKQEVAIVVAIERVLRDCKLADAVALMKESQWFHLKHRVIDTGSSFVAVPPAEYKSLQEKWAAQVEDLDCKSDPTFCSSRLSCESVAKKVKSVSFRIEDTMFEMKPLGFLHQGDGICQFAIA